MYREYVGFAMGPPIGGTALPILAAPDSDAVPWSDFFPLLGNAASAGNLLLGVPRVYITVQKFA